jgi:hypothetical protein
VNGATLAQIWCKITASNDWLSQSICLANLAVQGAQQNVAPAQPIAAVAPPRWTRRPRLLAGSSSPRSRSMWRSTLVRAYFRVDANPCKGSNHGCDSSRSSGFNHAATSERRLAFSGGADPLHDDIPF